MYKLDLLGLIKSCGVLVCQKCPQSCHQQTDLDDGYLLRILTMINSPCQGFDL